MSSLSDMEKNDDLMGRKRGGDCPTELLFDDLEDLLLIKLLGQSLNSGQGLTTIAFCSMCHVDQPRCACKRRLYRKQGDRLAWPAMGGRE